jgi:hypothetical protein
MSAFHPKEPSVCFRPKEDIPRQQEPATNAVVSPLMPFFHFQVRTESHVLLTEGAELSGLCEARIEAATRVGDLLKEHAAQIWADEHWQMDVTDGKGLILFVLDLSAFKTSATKMLT